MPVDLSRGRHYDGKSARAQAPWDCPNCGVKNQGPLVGGCTSCGSGVPRGPLPGVAAVPAPGGASRAELEATVARAVRAALVAAGVQVPVQEQQHDTGTSDRSDQPPAADDVHPDVAGRGVGRADDQPVTPVTPLTLPDIDTSDPQVRLTIAVALRDWANFYDTGELLEPPFEGHLTVVEALSLSAQLAPELVGEQVEPTADDLAVAEQVDAEGERYRAEIRSRLRAPNTK